MVDYDPYSGNYAGTVVRNNTILGGFASGTAKAGETKGENSAAAIIKYVIIMDRLFASCLTTTLESVLPSVHALGSVIALVVMSANLALSWTIGSRARSATL